MRSKNAAFLALLQGDQLDLVALVEIARASASPLRYALDTEARVWNGLTFTPTAGAFGEIQESAEREVPSLQLVLQNADGVLGPLCFPEAGGEDLRGCAFEEDSPPPWSRPVRVGGVRPPPRTGVPSPLPLSPGVYRAAATSLDFMSMVMVHPEVPRNSNGAGVGPRR